MTEPLVQRWSIADLDDWLLQRLDDRWPRMAWQSRLHGFTQSNDYLFVKNERCVLLGMIAARDPMTGKALVYEVLAWSRDSEKDKRGRSDNWVVPAGYENELLALYRHMNEWAGSMRAERVIVGACSDLSPSALKMALRGEYLVAL